MARILTGTTTVGTAGTAVRVDNTARRVLSITFKGRAGNTGNVYIGDSTVSASVGFELKPDAGFAYNFGAAGVSGIISDFYVDAATNGDKVDFAAIMWP